MRKTYSRKRSVDTIIEDVHELCRLCLARAENMIPIFAEVNNPCTALPMRIMSCVGHEITQEDCLPNSICTNCHQELEKYYKFRKKCEISYCKLKAHYNATKYQETITEQESKMYDKKLNVKQECQTQENETQDEMERLVIVDMCNIEENGREYDRPLMSSLADDVKVEETTEIQLIEQSDDVSPDISTFLSAILVELGILVKKDHGLVVQDRGVSSFELETGDDDHVEFELVEEDDEVEEPVEETIPRAILEVPDAFEIIDEPEEKSNRVRKDVVEGKKSNNGLWCSVCSRTFASRSALRRHGAVHSGARPHACKRCGRGFAQKAVMERHALVHDEVRPHVCSRCPKSFTQRGALEAHARSHRAPHARPLALHACSHCDRMFLHASSLSRHMLTHSGHVFACGTCERTFNDKSSLLRHSRNAHRRNNDLFAIHQFRDSPSSRTTNVTSNQCSESNENVGCEVGESLEQPGSA